MSQFSLISESNEKGKQFLSIWRNNEFFSLNSWANIFGTSAEAKGLIESSVLDDVKDDLVSFFLLSHSGINPHVCGTDLDSVSFGNPCLFTNSLLNSS
nr:hypothetical protein [Tanacetum cinerariifolium]